MIFGHPQWDPSIISQSYPQSIYTDLLLPSSGCSFAFALPAFHPEFAFHICLSKFCSSHALLDNFVDCCSYGNLFSVLTVTVLVVSITCSPSLLVCHCSPSRPLSFLECTMCLLFLANSTKHNRKWL